MKNNIINIGKRKVGKNLLPLIVVEIGINHGGSLEKAFKIVDSAINSGAEVIKHQTHIIDDEYSFHAKKKIPGNSNKSIYQIIKENSLDEEQEFKLMNYIKKRKKIFISTPFSRKAVDRLVKFNVPAFKIGSGECNNYPLVEYISKFKKTVILSTGMNSIKSISNSVNILKKNKSSFCLLHCTNLYPTPAKLVNLGAIKEMEKKFKGTLVGLSDHTENIYSSLAAITLGAPIIEKHFTFSKKVSGPDISSSMDPQELKNLILGSKEIFLAKGGTKKPLKQEVVTMNFAFASVIATRNILKGERLSSKNIWVKRPFGGDFTPADYYRLIGKKAKRNIYKDHQLKKKDL